jgi:murein DD-endopeptidase MepM/ murein hydrolase activator NlpD
MQLGSGQRRAFTTTLAAALLALAAGAPTAATAATGGAGPSSPSTLAKAPATALVPVLSPVRGLSQLAAGVALRRISAHAISAATLRYVSQAAAPVVVRVDVVRLADGLSIFHDERTAAPDAAQTIRWSGRAQRGVALDGRYELRLATGAAGPPSMSAANGAGGGAGGAAPEASAPPPGSVSVSRFSFVGAVFPVRGRHSFGDAANRFGAGRAGHVHQGQDVLARCGTPIVAAVGGVVRQRASQSAAGNYVVIDDPITGQSYFYAHLRVPALVGHGAQVAAGQQIGVVGETGDATTCHLHFEIWTAPGWYLGGQPIDPLPTLRRWDRLG